MLLRQPILLASVLLLAACDASLAGGEPPAGTIGVSPSAFVEESAVTSPSPSPSVASPAPPPITKQQPLIDVGGDVRRVDLFVPDSVAARGQNVPLVVLLHANGESPYRMVIGSKMDQVAAREGFILALPPGTQNRWRALVQDGDPITASPDLAYVVGMIEQLLAEYPVDPKRVYIGGFSMGATLSGRIACERADLVAGVAVVSGTPWSDDCRPSRPVSVLIMHGDSDNIFDVERSRAMAADWAAANGCTVEPESVDVGPRATSWASADCRDGTAVQYVEVVNGTHRWFGDPSATDIAWEFFASHPKG